MSKTSAVSVIRIKPFHYIHVLDNNKNVTRVEIGPQVYTRQEHEDVVQPVTPMIIIPPRHYCLIQNPILKKPNSNEPEVDKNGQVIIRHGDEEIRSEVEPFPLYPGEVLFGKVSPLQVVAAGTALALRAVRDFPDGKVKREAGDEWLFHGPQTYYPRIEVQVKEIVHAHIIRPNQALRLRAKKEFIRGGVKVLAGDEYLHRTVGSYIPEVEEEVVRTEQAYVLTDKTALLLEAVKGFTDFRGVARKAGEQWLVTNKEASTHIPDVFEKVVGEVQVTVLDSRQYCVILDPIEDGKPQLGKRVLRVGPCTFFRQPGERLEAGIQNIHVLEKEEALLLCARELYKEGEVVHQPGDRWMVYGPREYVPPVEVDIIEKRKKIALDRNEGVYVRDITTGRVRAQVGESYMLLPHEELWEKQLPEAIEDLLPKEIKRGGAVLTGPVIKRSKTSIVNFKAPHNSAVQIYDFKSKHARVVFGPKLVMLGPDEHFTMLSLSGGKPKQPHKIKALALLLGPDNTRDVVTVETTDHARLSLKLSYNWHFEVDKEDSDKNEQATKLFNVPDFIGDMCNAIASRVRGVVATETFDNFHKFSAKIIRAAVFGLDANGKVKDRYDFPANGLVVTNIDIQSVEPVDQRTRDALQKSVQLAIEITTSSLEAQARHEAESSSQEARGRLEQQKIVDEAAAEQERKKLSELQTNSKTVETTGQATAEAKARMDAAAITGQSKVAVAKLHSQAQAIKDAQDLKETVARQNHEVEVQKSTNTMELTYAEKMAKIEALKFSQVVDAIGKDTIMAIAEAGPKNKQELLKALGVKGFVLTDGNSPINLFSTQEGFLAKVGKGQ